MGEPRIRDGAAPAEFGRLVAIWRGAVDATHHFLADADRDAIEAELADVYLPAVHLVLAEQDGEVVGFAGVDGDMLEMLFVEASRRGTGIGAALLGHVVERYGVKAVDVNEQNPAATGFYLRHGFRIVGRSEVDGQGRPYPLLHLRLRGDGSERPRPS